MPHRRRDPEASPPQLPRGAASAQPFVVVVSGPQFGEVFDLLPGRELVLGRDPACDAVLLDGEVAPRHAGVRLDGDGARLADLGSASGTFVAGARVGEATLRDGARFQLGPHAVLKFVGSKDVEAEYQRRLAQGALHEPLTGLHNRRHFLERLASELAASDRHGRPLSLLAVDVDGFRAVNEGHGPLAADEALKMVAFVLQGAVRKEDVVARTGGQEFAVLARETGLTGGKALAERIRRAVERSRTAFGGVEMALTVTVGVAVSPGRAEGGAAPTAAALLDAARAAVGKARETGRNRVGTVAGAPR